MKESSARRLAAVMLFVLLPAVAVAICALEAAADNAANGKSAEKPSIGLRERHAWTTSRFIGSPDPQPQYKTVRDYAKLSFTRPVAITPLPGAGRLVVLEVKGRVLSFVDKAETDSAELMLDLSEHIQPFFRAYGVAFHPEFEKNRFAFLCYVLEKGDPQGTRVSRFRVTDTDPPRMIPDSENVLLRWPAGGHNGGCLKFGPDGYLYITTGDGQNPSPPDPLHVGQDLSDLRSTILRIDVDRTTEKTAYAVPRDNPFVGVEGARPEIWAYGFRNPWKISFDPASGDLWVGDVGWELWELVHRVQPGGNYGWSVREGLQPVNTEAPVGPTPLVPPVVALPHTVARSVTGGKTYEGSKLEELRGAYIYGDYVTGKLWALRLADGQLAENTEIANSPLQVIAFGDDTRGELLVLDYAGGVYRFERRKHAAVNRDFPRRLSESGLFASTEEHQPSPGVLTYSVNAQPWADGAKAERLIGVPEQQKLDVHQEQNVQVGTIKGEWAFPDGTVLAKTLSLPVADSAGPKWQRIETQVLHRNAGEWLAYTYRWKEDGSDAQLVDREGVDAQYVVYDEQQGKDRKQTWHFASRTECLVCHTTRAGSIHGFNRRQLNKQHLYGETASDQLATLEHIGLFEHPVLYDQPPQPDPHNAGLPLADRARSYLHVNCAHCHRRGGGGNAPFELQMELSLEQTGIVGMRPTQGTFGLTRPAIVAAGAPYRSVLLYRISKLGPGRMPHAGSNRIDTRGAHLLHDWIANLAPAAGSGTIERTESERQAQRAIAVLRLNHEFERRRQVLAVQRLLSTTSGALRLLWAIETAELPESMHQAYISTASQHADARIRDLFERFLPEEKRTKRLGGNIDIDALLAAEGDADRGKAVFFQTDGLACRSCHRIGDQGGKVGPELTQIGKKLEPRKLLISILEPSKEIDPKFVTMLVETSEGRVLRGLLSKKTDEEVVLLSEQGKPLRLPTEKIEVMVPQQKSLMPDLLLRDLTEQQAADLLAYLQSLK